MGDRSSAGAIEANTQVLIFIRRLAGASYHDKMLAYGVSRATLYKVIHHIWTSVLQTYTLQCLLCMIVAFQRKAAEFCTGHSTLNSLKGCMGLSMAFVYVLQNRAMYPIQVSSGVEKLSTSYQYKRFVMQITPSYICQRDALARLIMLSLSSLARLQSNCEWDCCRSVSS